MPLDHRRAPLRTPAIALTLLLAACGPGEEVLVPSGPGPAMRGMSFTSFRPGQYSSADAERSLDNLIATSANWMALLVTAYQNTIGSTVVQQDPQRTPTDADLLRMIDLAHGRGLRVLLVTHVDLSSDPSRNRSQIGLGFDDSQWSAWFASYGQLLEHYAMLAETAGAEALSVGTEMTASEARSAEWRALIARVRARFGGPLVYGCNWNPGPETIDWWDALDWIGVDAYYPLSSADQPDALSLYEAWLDRGYVDRLRRFAERTQKPLVLTEIGYRSIVGTANRPWDFTVQAPVSLEAQAAAYEAALAVFWPEPWLGGVFWWNWPANPRVGGTSDTNYTPHAKPATAVLRSFYEIEPPAARQR